MADIDLPVDSQRRLIQIARDTLESFVRRSRCPRPETSDAYLATASNGAFVTLYKQDDLRGCIGTCAPLGPLINTVVEMTEAAAARDLRVAPIQENELDQVQIHISVLSPLNPAADPLALRVGVHGLHIARKGKRGVLLPQVAAQRRWELRTFLEQTCIKAKLPKDAWSWPDTRVCSFEALIIEEEG